MTNDKAISELLQFHRIQHLLHKEANLLDSWQLNDWLAMFTEDGSYFVPPTDVPAEVADPAKHLYYIADNRARLEERVIRLDKKTCHSEYPRSKVQHLIGNIFLDSEDEQGQMHVKAAFVVYRSKNGTTDTFMGNYDYVLRDEKGELKIVKKTCNLALNGLRPQAKISIIL
ncbi:small subunit of phenylpropionate dioxygenase [Spongiibacter sp. IMCC21906]|jgi:p-cumate 2,3-dioxygenase beta subunit|uniref:aromatic-ring-hydroxylating dioxygenase subunit beta n=1 Tax=Spongiibacter sp. IMCC21906 TaxID=1620392 RepID=UPI00062E0214|nr:aromatic-ring-hydroxylating dioxygenase subunit beta [Spongiibacter sp. IMCC21906]AKH70356.1 small subunit of phenylpropionate dioxygenase [Spongiibacter sp. IMCC21906]